jgi:hypothetical protein
MAFTGNCVQSAAISSTSGTSTTKQYASNVTAGNLLVCTVGGFNGTVNPTPTMTCADDVNGAWSAIGPVYTPTDVMPLYIFYKENTAGGSQPTVTVTASRALYFTGAISEYSGVATASSLDKSATGSGTGTAPAATTAATDNADDLVISSFYMSDGTSTVTTPSGATASGAVASSFTCRIKQNNPDAETCAFEDKAVGATGA